jgi:polar amino acid transport system permease protein
MHPASFLQNAQDFLPILLQGAVVTVQVTVLSFLLSSALGFAFALMKLSPVRALVSGRATVIVNVIRGLPIIVQLFYIYFVLPEFGIELTAFQAGVIGLGIAYSAYQAENFRAGIEAVDPGQREAAQAMGMRSALIMRRVILPQAFRIALPPYGNTLVMMLKDSSLASTITVAEMTLAGQLIASSTFQNMTVYTLVALLYLLMSLPLVWGLRRLESASAPGESNHDRRRGLEKSFGAHRVLQGREPARGRGRGRVPDRPVGLGQIDGASLHQRAGIL